MGSPLLELPVELQLKIFADVFCSLHPTYPHFSCPSLLLTCRSIYSAAQPLYIKSTTLDLGTTINLVKFLTSLSAPRIKQLRHLSSRALPVSICDDLEYSIFHPYGLEQILPFIPDLQLDTLTITDAFHGSHVREHAFGHTATNVEVQNLVKAGCGWSKLFYRSENTAWLQPAKFGYIANNGGRGLAMIHTTVPKRQPGNWDRIIKQRDGPDSGANVRMWVRQGGNWVEVPARDEGGNMEAKFDWNRYDLSCDQAKYGNGDGSPQIEIQITRGRDADIINKRKPLEKHERKLHDLFDRMSWHEIKESGKILAGDDETPPLWY